KKSFLYLGIFFAGITKKHMNEQVKRNRGGFIYVAKSKTAIDLFSEWYGLIVMIGSEVYGLYHQLMTQNISQGPNPLMEQQLQSDLVIIHHLKTFLCLPIDVECCDIPISVALLQHLFALITYNYKYTNGVPYPMLALCFVFIFFLVWKHKFL
ncbi:hypothetical protein ACJX0J_020678, partial [Zea mays]